MEVFYEWLRISMLMATMLSPPPTVAGGDWPQWRGQARNGTVIGLTLPKAWPKTLKEQWKVPVGVGHATPIYVDGKIFHHTRLGEEEVLLSLDGKTGKELWRSALPVAYEMHPAARGHGKGPKSTPVYNAGRVYTFGISGVLSCHDARNGKVIWRKEFSKQYPKTSPLFGTAMSPLIEGGVIIAHVGGHDNGALTAFDLSTGDVKWAYNAGPAYSSPIATTMAGVRQIVTLTQKEVIGVEASSGKLLWKLAAKSEYDDNVNSPLVYKDTLIFGIEGDGLSATRIVKQGAELVPKEIWRSTDVGLYMNSPVIEGNLIYGFSNRKHGQFFCLNADTGDTVWLGDGRMGENAAIVSAGKALFLLNNEGNLIVLSPGAAKFEPVTKYTVATSPTWAHPVFVGNRVLIKDETMLASLAF